MKNADITYYEVRKNGVVLSTQSGLDKQTIREMRKAGYSVKEVKKDGRDVSTNA